MTELTDLTAQNPGVALVPIRRTNTWLEISCNIFFFIQVLLLGDFDSRDVRIEPSGSTVNLLLNSVSSMWPPSYGLMDSLTSRSFRQLLSEKQFAFLDPMNTGLLAESALHSSNPGLPILRYKLGLKSVNVTGAKPIYAGANGDK